MGFEVRVRERERVCVCLSVCERDGERLCARERESTERRVASARADHDAVGGVCVCVRERVCVCMRESVCVRECV